MKTLTQLIFTLILCITFSSVYSQTSSWLKIGEGSGSTYFIRAHQTSSGDNKKVWVKENKKNLEVLSKTTGKKIILINGYSIDLYEMDCENRQLKLISATYYNANGTVYKSTKFEIYEQEWNDVVPDSIGEFLLDKSCELL